jgi:hypothetical protein
MNTLIHADVFFFVTTIALIVVAVGVVIIIVYVIRILRDVAAMSRTIKKETEVVLGDIELLRTSVKNNGFKFRYLGTFIMNFVNMFRRYRKKKKERAKDDNGAE